MRFGFPIRDTGIRPHDVCGRHNIETVEQRQDVAGPQINALHVRAGDDVAEFALSVDRQWRGRGVGSELFDRAVLWARNRGIHQAVVYCLNENQAMRHIAARPGCR